MQAIRTKYQGPTNTKGTRITAKCAGGSLSVSYDYSIENEENHRAAAVKLAERLKWDASNLRGGSYGGDMYWVFAA